MGMLGASKEGKQQVAPFIHRISHLWRHAGPCGSLFEGLGTVARCDQGFKLVQHLAPECLRFSGESTAFGICETKASPSHALLKHAVLFLEILNHVQLMEIG